MPSLSGSNWWLSNALTGQNLGEDVKTGAGGQSLREAWQTLTANYSNMTVAQMGEGYTQFQYAHNIFMIKGAGGGEGSRHYGFIDFNAYGGYPYLADDLWKTVTGSFNVLTDSASAIILGQAGKGTVYIQGNDLNSFHTSQSQQTLNINRVGYNAGTAQFRDTGIGDGKGNPVLAVSGSTQTVVIGGPLAAQPPHTKLHVSGNVNAAGGLTSNTNTLVVDDAKSQVGIGKTDPAYPVDVVGIVKSSTNLLAANAVGVGTLAPGTVGHFYGDGAGAAGEAAVRIETGADGSDSIVEFKQTAVKGHVGYDDSSDRIFLTHSTTVADATKGIFINSAGQVTIGKASSFSSTYTLDVEGSLSANSISTNRFHVVDTFFSDGHNTLGNEATDVQTFRGDVYLPDVDGTRYLHLSGSSVDAKLYGDDAGTKGGGLVVDNNTNIRAGFAIGTGSIDTATLNGYDLWIKGGEGISVFEENNYILTHKGSGGSQTFTVQQDDGSSTYGLAINKNNISIRGSADAEVKMAIGCAPDSTQGLKIQGKKDLATLKVICTETNNGTSWLEHYEDQHANSVIRKPAGQHSGDIDICNQTGADVWLHAQGANGNVTFFNPDHGHGGSLEFQQPTASNWYIRNRDADGKIYFKTGSTNIGYFDKDGLTITQGGINASGPSNVVGWAFTETTDGQYMDIYNSNGGNNKWTFTATTGTYRVIANIKFRGYDGKKTQYAECNWYVRKAGASAWTWIGDWMGMDRYKNNGRTHMFSAFQGMFRVTAPGTWEILVERGSVGRVNYFQLTNLNVEWIGSSSDTQYGLTGPLAL